MKKGEAIPPDYEFVQCYECLNISPLYEAIEEPEIKDSEETIENPFENESVFMSVKKRKHKNRRLNSLLDDDPDIAAEQKRHGSDNVGVIE